MHSIKEIHLHSTGLVKNIQSMILAFIIRGKVEKYI